MRVLVSVVPLTGHVAPVTGLVAELVRRGHDVRVHTGVRQHARFAALGAEPLPWSAAQDFDEDDLAATFPAAARSRRARMMALVREGFIGTAPGQVADLRAALAERPADVLLADSMSVGGMLTGELTGIPWATVNVLPFALAEGGSPPGLGLAPARGWLGRVRDRALWAAYGAVSTPFRRAYAEARREVGLPPSRVPFGMDLLSPWLVLATGCRSLGDPDAWLPAWVHRVGVLPPVGLMPPGSPVPPAPPAPPATGPAPHGPGSLPLVLVTQGTHDVDPAELVVPALRGLADTEVAVLATTGRRGVHEVGLPVPGNARVVDLVDLAAVLPRTGVLVANGGWGGTLAGLAAGVPLVIAPSTAADKPYVARQVARAGAGVNLRTRTPGPAAVAAAVRRVLDDPGYRTAARALATELAACGGVSRAADLVERLSATGRPVLRD